MTAYSIEMTFHVNATPDEVFDLLTNQEKVTLWGGGKTIVEPKKGGKFEMFDGWVHGKVLDYTPGKSLSYTWRPDDFKKDWEDSVVSYHFTASKGGTLVTLEHHKLPNQKEVKNHESGWEDHVFGPINEFLTHSVV